MPRKKFFRLNEAVAMILEDDEITEADIVVLPPSTVDDQSDCEAIDENDLVAGDNFPSDVAGLIEVQFEAENTSEHHIKPGKRKHELSSELIAPARKSSRKRKMNTRYEEEVRSVEQDTVKIRAKGSTVPTESCSNDEHFEQDDEEDTFEPTIVSNTVNTKAAKTKSGIPKVQWTKQQPRYSSQPVNNEKHAVSHLIQRLIGKTESGLFHEFFDDQLVEYIIDQSKIYATQQNRHGFDVKPFQLQRFIGFLLFTGYHKLPREDMYWENAEDCSVQIVTNALSRQTFRDIKRNLHLCDNTTVRPDDKLYKIR